MDISTITKSVKHEFTFKLDSRLIASVYGKYNLLFYLHRAKSSVSDGLNYVRNWIFRSQKWGVRVVEFNYK